MRQSFALAVLAAAGMGCGLIDSISGPKSLAIQKFEATPEDVAAGSSVTLAWDVEGADNIAINNGVGVVPARGSRKVSAYYTTAYTLTARSGTSSATATVQVSVRGGSEPPSASPSPGPTPGPVPTPTPAPTPTPTPTPAPTPTPTPSPQPSPQPGNCGAPASLLVKGCQVGWEKPVELSDGQCIELNTVTVDQGCPVVNGTSLSVGFAVTAKTVLDELRWRLHPDNADQVVPAGGSVDVNGKTSVLLTDAVAGDAAVFEVVDASGKVRLRFRLKHR